MTGDKDEERKVRLGINASKRSAINFQSRGRPRDTEKGDLGCKASSEVSILFLPKGPYQPILCEGVELDRLGDGWRGPYFLLRIFIRNTRHQRELRGAIFYTKISKRNF